MSKLGVISQSLSKKIDELLFNKFKVSLPVAMELAGLGVSHSLSHFCNARVDRPDPRLLFIAGPGSLLTR